MFDPARDAGMDCAQRLARTYAAFNARDIDGALAAMHPAVDRPHGIKGGSVHGRAAIREYWTRQWAVDVHQVVRDRAGTVLKDEMVRHVYAFEDELIQAMEIRKSE